MKLYPLKIRGIMKKLIITSFILCGLSFAYNLSEPEQDLIRLNDWLNSHPYTPKNEIYEKVCYLEESNPLYIENIGIIWQYFIFCERNAKIGYEMPKNVGKLKKRSVLITKGSSIINYIYDSTEDSSQKNNNENCWGDPNGSWFCE